ncbi:hypothetical protein [uncultured Spirosoma sp.]|uniref:hypothetical protein n=1 Tax=uncultured Spirosoma sp. TaxID=278208 RepID=UPI00258F1727|nr:hypothetical protein [uncultured Spirosoma sp.]
MNKILLVTLLLTYRLGMAQDFGWKVVYSQGSSVIRVRIYVGDPTATKSYWRTRVYVQSTFAENVEYTLVADTKHKSGEAKVGALIGWGALINSNNHQNDNVYDYVSFANIRFRELKIGRSTIVKDERQVGQYTSATNSETRTYPTDTNGSGQRQFNGQNTYQQQAVLDQQRQAAEAEQQRSEQLQALDQQRQQALEEYNQQIANLQQQQVQSQQLIQSTAGLVQNILETEVDELQTADNLFLMGLGASGLTTPWLVSNRTTERGESSLDWSFHVAVLSRKGLSMVVLGQLLQQNNEKFVINAQGTSGRSSDFYGKLQSKLYTVQASLGKDIQSKSGKVHLFVGPQISWISGTEHSWEYDKSKLPYREKTIESSYWCWGGAIQTFFFLGDRLSLTGGWSYSRFFADSASNSLYKLNNYSAYNLGLSLRLL